MLWPMLLTGAGAGLPWGLMDGLSVSVVPKEQAGMATGIFGTVRVAGEGGALAMVGAPLAGLIDLSLAHNVSAPVSAIVLAGQRLAVGDMTSAEALLPTLGKPGLASVYGTAFSYLCFLLGGITILCAAGVTWLLGVSSDTAVAVSDGDLA